MAPKKKHDHHKRSLQNLGPFFSETWLFVASFRRFQGFEGHVLIHPSPKKKVGQQTDPLKWAGVGRWNDTLSGVTASTSSEDAGKIQLWTMNSLPATLYSNKNVSYQHTSRAKRDA